MVLRGGGGLRAGMRYLFTRGIIVVGISARKMGIFFCAESCCGHFCAEMRYLFTRGMLLWAFLRGNEVSFYARIIVVGVSARE